MSDTPLLQRLQVKHGRSLAVIDAPASLADSLGEPSANASANTADVILAFAADRAAMERLLGQMRDGLRPDAILWVAYPKLSSPLAADLSRDIIHTLAPTYGRTTVSQIAVDPDWSAMRLKRV